MSTTAVLQEAVALVWDELPDLVGEEWGQVERELLVLLRRLDAGEDIGAVQNQASITASATFGHSASPDNVTRVIQMRYLVMIYNKLREILKGSWSKPLNSLTFWP
jgi:hypothetical protein